MPSQSIIESGKGAMLKKGKNLKYVYIEKGKQEKMENFFFSCTDMINKPFGTAFKVLDKKHLEVIDPIQVEVHRSEYEKLMAEDVQAIGEETKDNRSIIDSAHTQKLDKATIMGFREEGMEGEKIVEKLIENSATFKDRTEFSQAKYLKKKEKKYLKHFVALRPSARLLCEMYFSKAPDKILDMRSDSLAQLLTWSNVQSGNNVLLMETCKGLITGAVMERLGNEGTVLQFHQGNNPARTITEQFNFSVEDVERLACSFPMEKLDLFQELKNAGASRDTLLEHILGRNYVHSEESSTDKPVLKEGTTADEKEISSDKKSTTENETPQTQISIKKEEISPEKKATNESETPQTQISIKKEEISPEKKATNESETPQTQILIKKEEFSPEKKPTNDSETPQTQILIQKEEISPEKLQTEGIKEYLPNLKIKEEEDATMERNHSNDTEQQKGINLEDNHKGNEKSFVKNDKRKRKHGVDGNEKAMKTPRVCYLPKEKRVTECKRAMDLLSAKNFDCLILASKYHPKKLLLALLEYLPIGRPFVVYCQHQEPLMECSVTLREMKCATNIEITETWFRNLQVLSNRTHPEIVMSATGGYILRGFKVAP